MLESFFKLKEHNTTLRTEINAGFVTFFSMSYIIFVNPAILSLTGMDYDGVFVSTILATIVGTLIMGLYANVPYAEAPGMGLNAFFTYTVCFSMGFAWQEALAMVFICGLINMLITVFKLRKAIMLSIPKSVQSGIGGAIGLFVAYIGIKGAGFLKFTIDPGTYVQIGETVIADSSIIPSIISFNQPRPILALIGVLITIALLVLKVKGAIFISIVLTTLIGIPMGITDISNMELFNISRIGNVSKTAFSFFGEPGIVSMFNAELEHIFIVLMTIFAFSITDIFDTVGAFIGTGRVSGIFDEKDEEIMNTEKKSSKIEKAFFADFIATSIGALMGTSNVTTVVECSTGISEGGRTGLTSVVVAILFLLCLPFAGIVQVIPAEATAPALIVVGIMMASAFKNIDWSDFTEAVPAFMIAIFTGYSYSISNGIAVGFILYCFIKVCKRETKTLPPILIDSTFLFILNFTITAIQG